MENSLTEFRAMRKVLHDVQTKKVKSGAAKLAKLARKAGEKLRAMDIDRRLVAIVLGELAKVAAEAPGRVVEERLAFNPRGTAFKTYHHEVEAAVRAVQRAK